MTQTNTVRQHGPAIRALRRKDGLSCAVLAERVGLHEQSLRNIELDRKPASWETLNAIARALRVEVAVVSHPGYPGQDGDER
ncbi:helix-turn-helix transcriptional regulator [Streptosporangium sp. NBC_01755]|uniref:helix-turn-helix domain-containing protein n=1 Tax=Streptosporangium sp. NBC_01755 TaxID=2975949 RepID=UPI002DDC6257|nr:helix-turn-helix transcriptional regulator [Streptosporangium sp. NBC_01755]WSD03291.1 helix-turn-helix transcriptional regulator [Streptosporangium sp. NBC_01755]